MIHNERNFKLLISIAVTALFFTACSPAYVTTSGRYYNPSYGNHYGDGQPDGYYYNSNTQTYYQQQSANVAVSLSFNDFYSQLSPYGVWVNIHPYGQVWVSNVRNFQPYSTNGYWAYSTYGWTWVSNYEWGWAPFHYGRWGYDNRYGWYWVPGYEWGPAWVAWSSSNDMYGWAPLMPGMNYDVRMTVNLFPSSYWTFMPGRHMGSTNIGGYYVNRSQNVTIINNTTIINNYGSENNRRYSMGPNSSDVQRYTGRDIQTLRVSNTSDRRSTGVRNDELHVYRPTMSTRSTSTSDNNNRTSTQQTRSQTDQATSRTQTDQSTTRPTTTGRSNVSTSTTENNNRVSTSQTNTQNNQSSTRTQTDQPASRSTVTPRSGQNDQSSETREYRPTQDQPRVSNRAAPQTARQIQRAQSDNINSQQQQDQQQEQPQRQRRSSTSSSPGRR